MRTSEEHPANSTEQIIFSILVKSGINPEDIQFRGGPNHSHKGRRYLRIGYWRQMDAKLYQELEPLITEDDMDDDDCGILYSYPFKVQPETH